MAPDRTVRSTSVSSSSARPLSSTCLACRARKVKCAGPASPLESRCPACLNSGAECVFKERQKPGLKSGTGQELLDRVAALEEALQQQTGRIDNVVTRLDSPRRLSAIAPPPAFFSPAASAGPSSFGRHESEILVSDTSTFASTSQPHPAFNAASLESPAMSTTSFLDASDLPPNGLILSLIDLFYQHVAPFAPFLRREEVSPHPVSNLWPITTYAVVAVSLRFSFDSRWSQPGFPSKIDYHRAAKQRVVMHAIESTSVASLQSLALIALDTIGEGAGPTAWGSLALITRATTHVSLQIEEDTSAAAQVNRVSLLNPPSSFTEEEGRRRLWWNTFVMDRWTAVSTGWEFALSGDVSRNLPTRQEAWLLNSPLKTPPFRSPVFDDGATPDPLAPNVDAPYAALVEIVDLLGRVHLLHRQPFSPVKEADVEQFLERTRTLDACIRIWFSRLPGEVGGSPSAETQPLAVLVQALYHATLIKLHSIIAYPPHPSSQMRGDREAAETVRESAVQLSVLARLISVDGDSPNHSPYLAWSLWVGARVLFVDAYHSGHPPNPALQDLLSGLDLCAIYWDLARRYSALLKRAIKRLEQFSSAHSHHHLSSTNHHEHPPSPASLEAALTRETAVSALLDFRKTSASAAQVPPSGSATPAATANVLKF